MKLQGAIALVTGSNQGIGRGLVEVLLERGAAKVYATARRPETLDAICALDPARVSPLKLDIVIESDRRAAAAAAADVTLLINNAGIPGDDEAAQRRFVAAPSLDDARHVMETDFWATAEMCRAFIPTLLKNRGGIDGAAAIANILSIGALFCLPEYATYCAAKSAAAVMTTALRAELSPALLVSGVFTAGVETRMSMKNGIPKMSPVEHAHQVLSAIEQCQEDIFSGSNAEDIRDAIRKDPKAFERDRIARFRENPLA